MTEMNSIRLKSVRELKAVMTSPLFGEAIEAIRRDTFTKMIATNPDQGPLREALYQEIKAIDRLVAKLKSITNELVMMPGEQDGS